MFLKSSECTVEIGLRIFNGTEQGKVFALMNQKFKGGFNLVRTLHFKQQMQFLFYISMFKVIYLPVNV